MSVERVLAALGRLQDAAAEAEPLVSELVVALAEDTTAADLRQETEFLRESLRRCISAAGHPDPAEGCRVVIRIAGEALR